MNSEEEKETDKNQDEYKCKLYLPSSFGREDINQNEYLENYVKREFPESQSSSIYSVPDQHHQTNDNAINNKQATYAEMRVFNCLKQLQLTSLWMVFFHNAFYAGKSYRNKRIGKLMIREHDFVLFVKFNNEHFVILLEVKSSSDCCHSAHVEKVSDSKTIKNNKRSAQHQLRDHLEVLQNMNIENIQTFIMWPFLQSKKGTRWTEDGNLHVFEETMANQAIFNQWFEQNVLKSLLQIEKDKFTSLLNRFIIMSCGAFVNEINNGMLALLTQQQYNLLNSNEMNRDGLMVVHGAAGTGKTLLVLRKLEMLHRQGLLNKDNRALYICYWPGIRCDVELKLQQLGIKDYVDTCRFYITLDHFATDYAQHHNKRQYKHIFMDEAEALCLAFKPQIIHQTLKTLYSYYHTANCLPSLNQCKLSHIEHADQLSETLQQHAHDDGMGAFWILVDSNQALLFMPSNSSPQLLKQPNFILTSVMRSSGNIFKFFTQFYTLPIPNLPETVRKYIPEISSGHHVSGPPVYWSPRQQDKQLMRIVIDLCGTKGFKASDICILPFFQNYQADDFNKEIDELFVANSFRPQCVKNVEHFLIEQKPNEFLLAWALRVKGLEFKVVVMVMDEEDFDASDWEDRRKVYIMASRCTTMLILVCNEFIRDVVMPNKDYQEYSFTDCTVNGLI